VQIVLKVWSSNPDYNGGCDFAVVEITPELAKLALRRITLLGEQRGVDSAVCETSYWASDAEYFSPWLGVPDQSDEVKAACLKLEEELESLQIDRREVVAASDNFCVPQSQIARVECAQMVVREEGIAFTAIPKHNDFYVTTAEIPKGVLEQAAMAI
jgi:sulfur carrier protein ThiS